MVARFVLTLISVLAVSSCNGGTLGHGGEATSNSCRTELVFADHETELSPKLQSTIRRFALAAIAQGKTLSEVSPSPTDADRAVVRARQENVVRILMSYDGMGLKALTGYQPQDAPGATNIVLSLCR